MPPPCFFGGFRGPLKNGGATGILCRWNFALKKVKTNRKTPENSIQIDIKGLKAAQRSELIVLRQNITFSRRHRPPAVPQPIVYTSYCKAHQRLSIKCKIFPNYWNTAKTQGRNSTNPPPRLCTAMGVWLCFYFRGITPSRKKIRESRFPQLHNSSL